MKTQLHVQHGSMTCRYLDVQFGDYRLAIGDDLFLYQFGSEDCLKSLRPGGKNNPYMGWDLCLLAKVSLIVRGFRRLTRH